MDPIQAPMFLVGEISMGFGDGFLDGDPWEWYLEDHPRTCKWLITMVIVSLISRVVGPLPNGLFMTHKRGLPTTYKSWDEPPSSTVDGSEIPRPTTVWM